MQYESRLCQAAPEKWLQVPALLVKGGGFTPSLSWQGSCSLFQWVTVKTLPLEEVTHAWFPLPIGLTLHGGRPIGMGS